MKINFKKREEALRETDQEQGKDFSIEYLLQVKTDEVEAVDQAESINLIDNHMAHDTKAADSFFEAPRYAESSNRATSYLHEEQLPVQSSTMIRDEQGSPSLATMIQDEQGFESPFYESSVQQHTHEHTQHTYDPQFEEEAWAEITKFATELSDDDISAMHKQLLTEVSEQTKTAYVAGESIKVNKESSSWEG